MIKLLPPVFFHCSQKKIVCITAFLFFISVNITFAQSDRQALIEKHSRLTAQTEELLQDIAKLRAQDLARLQEDIRENLEEWENDEAEMDGESMRAQLRKALDVAYARNLPVAEITKIFEIAKKSILRADYASLCGGGTDMEDTLVNIAKTAEETITGESADHYFTLSKRTEGRMLCEQEKRMTAFKGAWRHYIRALITPSPGQAAEDIRNLADVAMALNEAEAGVLKADAEILTARLGQAQTILEMAPVVSDAFDVVTAWNGETLTGEQLSALEQGFTWVNVLYPDAFGIALGYAGKAGIKVTKGAMDISTKSIAFLWKLAVPDSATKQLAQYTKRNMDDLSRRAKDALEYAKNSFRKRVDDAASLARKKSDDLMDFSRGLSNYVKKVNFIPADVARLSSDMPGEWITALASAAKNTGTILIARPVNRDAKILYKHGIGAPKPFFVKSKTSEIPGLKGFIPVDQGLSKAARDGAEAVADKNAEALKHIADGYAIVKPVKGVDGRTVHSALDASGRTVILKKTADGKYIDASLNRVVDQGQFKNIKPVEALCDPHTGKYLTGDMDMVGVGTRNPSGTLYNGKTMDPVHGNIQAHEQDIHGQINIFARLEAKKSGMDPVSPIQHGGAARYVDPPEEEGLTIVLPDGMVGTINSHEDLVRIFKYCKENGFKGLEWHPSWGEMPEI